MKCSTFFFCIAILIGSTRAQIVGGEDANIKDFPHMASLRLKSEHYCGACIIGERHVVTAAHCIDERMVAPYRDVSVHTGTTSSRNNAGEVHRIASITVHPYWMETQQSSFNHDIAVITLKKNIVFNSKQRSIKLASTDVISGTNAIVTGWGRTSAAKGAKISETLQMMRLTLLDSKDCQIDHSIGKLYDEQLCAYYTKGHGPCFGDSGGPLINDLNEFVGILSWMLQDDCANGMPEVYANVYAYKNFITNVMNSKS